MNSEISISGAGIAGLVTAIALNKIGVPCTVYEAASEIKPLGAGLVLAANAIKAFEKIGIDKEIISKGRLLESFAILDKNGKTISRTDSKAIGKKFGTDNFTIHRARLHEALLSLIDSSRIKTGKKIISADQSDSGVTLHFADGTTAQTGYLVAADGIHSHIRKLLIPNTKERYAGYTCWRGIVEDAGLILTESTETWGPKGRFGIVPLAEGKIYWFASVNAKQNDPVLKNFEVNDLLKHFAEYHSSVKAVLQNTSESVLLLNDIIDLEPINNYAFGKIVLIGDAAHATTPNMGQGACQAIEDAVILAVELSKAGSIEDAFERFSVRRIKRTHFIVNNSWKLGKMAQSSNPLFSMLRNFTLRLIPSKMKEAQLKKIYDVDF
ncbi:MAG: FAD-dependent monooxygenase [Ignavibacteria bacterium]|nr:FAD-dependent monooxygenase [Ignavibacteria bacterium]